MTDPTHQVKATPPARPLPPPISQPHGLGRAKPQKLAPLRLREAVFWRSLSPSDGLLPRFAARPPEVHGAAGRFRAERRGRSAAGSAQLPQFDLQAWEAVDPDRTLERLPALSSTGTSRVSSPAAPHREAYAPIQDSESDLAATVEIVPEVSVGDILESEPSRPALALPRASPFQST